MNRKLHQNGQSLNSDYRFLCPDKLEPSEEAVKQEKEVISQELLKKWLDYNPKTGEFTRKMVCDGRFKVGEKAGSLHKQLGYIVISVMSKPYYAHRLAFIWMGEILPEEVDHINHIRHDNRWANLRSANKSLNTKNIKISPRNTSGYTGVDCKNGCNRWRARIRVNGKQLTLGYFDRKEDAIKARKAAEKKYGFHPNHGK
jgi:hypothetical protein